jgi:hypothetical protein
MATSPTIVIVNAQHVAAVRRRMADDTTVIVISEGDLLNLHDSILDRAPESLVMHPAFATSSRGATLVSGLKANGRTATAVRVFIEDEDKTPLLLTEESFSGARSLHDTSRPLDRAGTRQAARYPMNRRPVVVNGEGCQLVDLSVSGAQVQVPMRLRPSQVVRLILPAEGGDIRCPATIAWSIAVPAGGKIQYRAGVEFVGADATRLTAFCKQFGGAPDPTLHPHDRT